MTADDIQPGTRYVHRKRSWQKIQVEAISDEGLVCILFLRSKERLRVPRMLFLSKFKRDTVGSAAA